jgi:hypothetical protein
MTELSPERLTAERRLYRRIVIAWSDYTECRDFLYVPNIEELPRPIPLALSLAAVLAYSRLFTDSDGADHTLPKLTDRARSGYSEAERELHERLLSHRHQILAHSDPESYDVKVGARNLREQQFLMPVSNVTRQALAPHERDLLKGMCTHLHVYLHDEMVRLSELLAPHGAF